jgi:hypothetical protein
MKKILLVTAFLLSLTISAQYGHRDGNRIGISAGVTQTSLMTSNFNAKPELGFAGGFSVRGNYYNNFSMAFGMQFFQNRFSLETTTLLAQKEDVVYTTSGVQVRLILSYNLIEDHLSLDLGPVLQVNDKLKISSDKASNTISGTLLNANDIVDVTKINGNLYAGLSGGSRRVKVVVSYQYGLNNFLNKLNKNDELQLKSANTTFTGHLGILSGQLLISL